MALLSRQFLRSIRWRRVTHDVRNGRNCVLSCWVWVSVGSPRPAERGDLRTGGQVPAARGASGMKGKFGEVPGFHPEGQASAAV
eukprot:scaffold24481_cov125-Isochrysis_galbana.AAC.2